MAFLVGHCTSKLKEAAYFTFVRPCIENASSLWDHGHTNLFLFSFPVFSTDFFVPELYYLLKNEGKKPGIALSRSKKSIAQLCNGFAPHARINYNV